MDPYLEAPDIWPDLHEALAGEIRAELNLLLPQPYYARLEVRPEIGIVDIAGTLRRIVSVEVTVASEPLRHQVVELRDASRGHKLITLIEIVSPSNKRAGVDRRAYLRKQREILESDASLVEIDLLRAGERLLPNAELEAYLLGLDQPAAYLVLVNRAWCRLGVEMAYQLFTVRLRDVLPCIAIPLRAGEDEITLDLQWIFKQAYDRGPYRRGAVDYAGDPELPLEPDDLQWVYQQLREQGLRA
jgi:hypothetical protein